MLLFDLSGPLAAEELAWVGRGVAEALARLHGGGRAHGSVDARHVVFDGPEVMLLDPPPPPESPPLDPVTGRPVPRYGPGALAAPPPTAEGDVRDLGRLLHDCLTMPQPVRRSARPMPRRPRWLPEGLLPALPRPPLARRRAGGSAALLDPPPAAAALADIARLALAEGAGPNASAATASPPTAAAMAALITLRIPDARPPGGLPPSPGVSPARAAAASPERPRLEQARSRRPRPQRTQCRGRARLAGALSMLAVVVSAAWLAVALWAHPGRARASGRIAPAATPVVATAEGRFAIGQPGDVVLTGDWYCRGSPVPALLRPATGEVFVFDRFPAAAEDVPGRAVATVPGATSLRAFTSTRPDCPGLAAGQPGRAPRPIPIPPEATP